MKCTFCGTENVAGRTHCIACGTELPVGAGDLTPLVPSLPVVSEPAPLPVVVEPVEEPFVDSVPLPPVEAYVAPAAMPTEPQMPVFTSNYQVQNEPVEDIVEKPLVSYSVPVPTVSTAPSLSLPPVIEASVPPVFEPAVADVPSILPNHPLPSEPFAPSLPAIAVPEPIVAELPKFEPVLPAVPDFLEPKVASPRVDVQFDDAEVAEVPMPVRGPQVAMPSLPESAPVVQQPQHSLLDNSVVDAPAQPLEQGSVGGDIEPRTGPWLALTVLGLGLLVLFSIIYFVYQLIFGSASGGVPSTIQTPLGIPTTPAITTRPTATTAPVISSNDQQRERDVGDLKAALGLYFADKQRFPQSTSYAGLLNTLISGGYLTRRVQDPLFPTRQYQYSVGEGGATYQVTVIFDSLASTLLNGSTTYQFTN
ncbi:hypothetical protein KA517_01360 [Candidatus Gracilibacteria bacterium]|nr:hypothetical protein [Candidatus Gracilibacteria bacterium]